MIATKLPTMLNEEILKDVLSSGRPVNILRIFLWSSTPQGHQFWSDVEKSYKIPDWEYLESLGRLVGLEEYIKEVETEQDIYL